MAGRKGGEFMWLALKEGDNYTRQLKSSQAGHRQQELQRAPQTQGDLSVYPDIASHM